MCLPYLKFSDLLLKTHLVFLFGLLWCISVPEDYFKQANSEDADEIPNSEGFYIGLHCLPEYPFMNVCTCVYFA